jgi:hypothetical protein
MSVFRAGPCCTNMGAQWASNLSANSCDFEQGLPAASALSDIFAKLMRISWAYSALAPPSPASAATFSAFILNFAKGSRIWAQSQKCCRTSATDALH